jgi:predicted dehydrogenase
MLKAAKKNNSIVQVGQWQRSDPHWLDAVDFLRSGKLGKIRLVRVYSYQGWNTSIPVVPDGPAPAGVDMTCGSVLHLKGHSIRTGSISPSAGSGIMQVAS